MDNIFIKNVRRIIKEKGLKQYVVGEKAGYTSHQFNAMLTGRKLITVSDVIAIMRVLEVDANSLFRDKNEVNG